MDTTAIFKGFNAKKVLIVGDAMIDAYMWGNINRMSPEAPVPVVEVHTHENRLGGAANVALNLKALGATPILCAVIGDDNKGALFQQLMAKQQLSTDGILIDKKRKTSTKTRVIAQQKHQLRVDEEDIFSITVENEFLKLVHALITDVDVIIFQDYNKGVLTPKVIEEVIKMANKSNIPTIVDPKKQNFTSYKNCTIFKPNLAEIKAGIEISFSADNIEELQQATTHLRTLLNAEGVLLTLSEQGICINTKDTFKHTPTFPRDIVDISGAGDTVLSVAALCLASNLDYETLSIVATLAGGLVCEEVGVVPINKEQLIAEVKKYIH
jgi:rfaE bifunctional protein kinase chain/domain